MTVDYSLSKPMAGVSRAVPPTEVEILSDVSDTIADVGNRLSTLESGKQPLDSDLTAIAALDSSSAGALATDGAGWVRKTYAQLKTALGLTKSDVGLGSVDNTSDAAKPVSAATQTALNLKAPLASPALTGTPTVPTAPPGDDSEQVANTAFVKVALDNATSVTAAELAVAQITSGFIATPSDSATRTDVTGLTITVPDSPHPTMIEFSTRAMLSDVANTVVGIEIFDATAGVVIGSCTGPVSIAGYGAAGYARARVPASAGERTYKVRVFRPTGTGDVSVGANATGPAILSARIA